MRKSIIAAFVAALVLAVGSTVIVVVTAQGQAAVFTLDLNSVHWLEIIVFLGIFLGCLFRTLAPAVKKMRSDPNFKWNQLYTATVITSFLVALATAIIGFAGYLIPTDIGTGLRLFAVCFVYGVGLNSTINEAASWFKPA